MYKLLEKYSCYGCENRKVGCHSKCKKYKEYCIKKDVINKKKKIENIIGGKVLKYVSFIK